MDSSSSSATTRDTKRTRRQAAAAAVSAPQTSPLPTLLTTDDVAAALRTTRMAVYAMVYRGQIPGVIRLGRRILFRGDELLDWLHQKSTPSQEHKR